MSPEQVEGREIDGRSDLVSLRAVLYRLVSGQPAFAGDTVITLARKICDHSPPPVIDLQPDTPKWRNEIIQRLLAKQPADRIPSADELLRLAVVHRFPFHRTISHVGDRGLSEAAATFVSDGEIFVSSDDQQILPGLSISPSGEATVDPALAEVLFDLALKLDETMPFPVDVQHVLAAIVLADRSGQLDPNSRLSSDDPELVTVLASHVKTVFEKFGGKLGSDD